MSLMGTMIGPPTQADDLLQQIAALSQAPNPDLEAAKQQAAQAQQAYGSAAAQPPPQLDPAAMFIPALLGNVASVLSGNQNYQQNAQEELKAKKSELLKARADNLQALRDTYLQQADQAQKLGDIDTQAKLRAKVESLSRTHEQLLQTQQLDASARQGDLNRKSNMEEARLRGEYGLREAQIRANRAAVTKAAVDPEAIEAMADAAVDGQFPNASNIPKEVRGDVMKLLKSRGQKIMPQTVRKSLDALGSAVAVVDDLEALSLQVNTVEDPGFLGMNAAAKGATNWLGSVTQTDAAAKSLADARVGLAGNLSRAIAAERGVLTDQDLRRALRLIPDLGDTKQSAANKIARLRRFIEAKQNIARLAYTTEDGGVKIQRARNKALGAIRTGNRKAFDEVIAEFPDLDEDTTIVNTIEAVKAAKKKGKR